MVLGGFHFAYLVAVSVGNAPITSGMLVWSSSFSNCADSFLTKLPIATALDSVSNFTVEFGLALVLIMSLAKISARVSA